MSVAGCLIGVHDVLASDQFYTAGYVGIGGGAPRAMLGPGLRRPPDCLTTAALYSANSAPLVEINRPGRFSAHPGVAELRLRRRQHQPRRDHEARSAAGAGAKLRNPGRA